MAAHHRGSNPYFTLTREESTNDNDDASDCMDTKPQAVDSKIPGATKDTLHPPLETSLIHGSTVLATVEDTLSTQFRTVTTRVEARPAQTTTTITSNKDQHSSTRMVSRPMPSTQERTSSLSIRQESVSFATLSQPHHDQKPAASSIMSREQLQTQTCSSSSVESRQPEATVAASATPKSKRAKRRTPAADSTASYSTGRWTDAEHEAFLRGLQLYGREWKKVASHIPTRTSAQVRSHAQKHFVKLQRDEDALGVVSSSSNARQSSQTATTLEGLARGLSPAAQSTLARIMAHPELVEQEVEVTMQRLAQRYRQLQDRLRHMEREEAQAARLAMARKRPAEQPQQPQQMIGRTNDDRDERTLGLEDEELIAVSVLHAALPRSADGMSHGGGGSNEASLASELETMDTCNSSTNTTHDGGDENTTTSNESLSSNKRSKVMDFSSS